MLRLLLLVVFLLTESYLVFVPNMKEESQLWAINPPDDDGETEDTTDTDDSDGEDEEDDDCEDDSPEDNPDEPEVDPLEEAECEEKNPQDSKPKSEDDNSCANSPISLPTRGEKVKLHILFDQNATDLQAFSFGPGTTLSMLHTLKLKGTNGIDYSRAYIRWANWTKYDHGLVLYEKKMEKVLEQNQDPIVAGTGDEEQTEEITPEYIWQVTDHAMTRSSGKGTGGFVVEQNPIEGAQPVELTYFDRKGNRYIFSRQFFDENNIYRINRIIDNNNNTTFFNYTSSTELTITDPSLNQYIVEANYPHSYTRSSGNVTLNLISKITTIPAGQTELSKSWSYDYDENGRVKSETFNELLASEGYGTYGFKVNSQNVITEETDFKGQTESWVYEQDSKNKWYKSEKTLKNGDTIFFDRSENAQGYEKFIRYPDGRTKIETYHRLNIGDYKVQEVLPNGLKITLNRDERGNVVERIEKSSDNLLTRVTEYKYNSDNQAIEQVKDVLGLRQTFKYTYVDGYKTSEINPEGFETKWFYDQNKNVIKTQLISGNKILENNYEYDAFGKITKSVDRLGHETNYVYNALGQLTRKTDRRGFDTTYTYDIWGNLMTKTNARGAVVTYEYDLLNRLTKVIDELGFEESYFYDGNNNKIQITDKKGIVTNYDFNELDQNIKVYGNDTVGVGSCSSCGGTGANSKEGDYFYRWDGLLLSYTDLNGTITAYDYDLNNKVIAISTVGTDIDKTILYENDDLGRRIKETHLNPQGVNFVTSYVYNLLDFRVSKSSGLGFEEVIETYNYDLRKLLVSKIDAKGFEYNFNYDGFGRLVEESNPQGLIKQYEYSNRNELTKTIVDPDGLNYITTYIYDNEGNLVSITSPDSSVVQSVYDQVGNRTVSIDPLNDQISFGYNLRNEMIQSTDAGNFVTSYTYDELGNRKTMTDALGRVDEFEYDDKSFLINKIEDLNGINRTSQFTRDEFLNLTSMIDASGLVITHEYDNLHRRIRTVEDPSGFAVETSYQYDDLGNLLLFTDAAGFVTQNTYDSLNRVVKTQKPDGGESQYYYDDNGNMVTKVDKIDSSTNLITDYEYDEMNRLTKTIENSDNLQITTSRSYDILGRLEKLTDSNGSETNYSYDSMNRIVSETYADGGVIQKSYDLKGRLISRTDQNGDSCVYSYNSRDLLAQKDYGSNGIQTFTYDALRRMVSSTDNNEGDLDVICDYVYDALHRKVQDSQKIGSGPAQVLTKTYDAYGHELTCEHPNGRVITKTYTTLHQVDQIFSSGNSLVNYDYEYEAPGDNDKRKLVESKSLLASTGISADLSYDQLGRVTEKSWGQNLVGFQHTYNLVGNRTSDTHLHNPSDSETYVYDEAQRFKGYTRNDGFAQNWQLDDLGNWTSFDNNGTTETRTHSVTNEIETSSLTGATSHDNNGNMRFHDGKEFVWDTNNRLREVYSTSGNGAISKYYYNAMNLRVRKDIDSDEDGLLDDTTLYYYCGQRVCEERDGNNNFKRDYVHGGQFIDEVIMTSDVAGAIGTFSLCDLRYSVYAVVDADGNVLERYKYDPYGKRYVMTAGFVDMAESAIGQEFGYTGRRHDVEDTGLMYFRARYYSGELGRFVSRDPLGTALDVDWITRQTLRIGYSYKTQGMSLYMSYFDINGIDPKGTEKQYIYDRTGTGKTVWKNFYVWEKWGKWEYVSHNNFSSELGSIGVVGCSCKRKRKGVMETYKITYRMRSFAYYDTETRCIHSGSHDASIKKLVKSKDVEGEQKTTTSYSTLAYNEILAKSECQKLCKELDSK